MKREEAEELRKFLIKQFEKSELIEKVDAIYKKLGIVVSIDDWALTVDELMALPLGDIEFQFMAQIEKLAKVFGCSPSDAQSVAIHALGSVKIKR